MSASWEVGSGVSASWEVGSSVSRSWEVDSGVSASWEVGSGVSASWEVGSGVSGSWEVDSGENASWEVGNCGDVLEWYDFGRAEWAHVRDGALDLALGTLLPVAGFYVLYRLVSFEAAIVAVVAWAGCVFAWHYWRAREFDVFSFTTLLLACVKATAGLLSTDVRLYLVWPSVENLLYGTVFLVSAWLGRPLLVTYARRLYPIPSEVTHSNAFRHGFLVASLAWALVSLLRAGMRVWLVATLPLGLFLVTDSVIGWPMYLVLIWFSGWYPLHVLRQDGQVLP